MIRQANEPVPLCRAVAELLELSDERDAWLLRLGTAQLDAYDIGFAVGVAVGRRQVLDEEAAYRRATAALTRNASAGRPFSDLEMLRWGPCGREHFADPRPGDYPGRDGAA
jgi:hypothetical protein